MPLEIERKFLVKGEAWRALVGDSGRWIRQGYLCRDPQRTVRIRIYGEEGFLTIKTEGEDISRDEFEYSIPSAHASELLDRICLRPLIEKIRYRIPWGRLTIEVDEFRGENSGLIVAEVEFPDAHTVLEPPDWLGEDVSLDLRYRNSQLAFKPYSAWERATFPHH